MILDPSRLESELQALGMEIFQEISSAKLSVFDSEFYLGKMMDWAMKDEEFKLKLFRFIDVFPALGSSSAIVRHAQEYFDDVSERIPGILRWGLKVSPDGISAIMGAKVIAQQMRQVASRFIIGEELKGSLRALKEIRHGRRAFTVLFLGEGIVSEQEALDCQRRYLELIDALGDEVPGWREARPIVEGHRGEQVPSQISIKPSALYSQIRGVAHDECVLVMTERFAEIVRRAKAKKVGVFVDMEDAASISMSLEMIRNVLSQPEFRDFDQCGFVLQAYLRRTESDLETMLKWVRERGAPVGIRLVKGGYWDAETLHSRQRSYANPAWERKGSTDACFERLTLRLLENHELIHPAFGSHNVRSLCFAVKAAEHLGVSRTHFELQVLHGMADPLRDALTRRGFLVREYSPIGSLIPGMSYLVRRLLENSSNESFLRQSFYEHDDPALLLKAPAFDPEDRGDSHLTAPPPGEFRSVANTGFGAPAARSDLSKQLELQRQKLRSQPLTIKPYIAGTYISTERKLEIFAPEDQSLKIADLSLADQSSAESAIAALANYFPVWRDTPVADRAAILFRAAELIQRRRVELNALIILEVGKTWIEADVEVSEAIDFCNYYAIEALRISPAQRMGNYPGEVNRLFYEGRGVTSVISPWNFPFAIPCGMFAASLVMGNTTLLKPAEQSSAIGSALFDTFIAAGLPERAAAFLPGEGEEIGPLLTEHREVATIAFTGSKAVGLEIVRRAAEKPGRHVKRVIAEMGGKNAIIVDDDADLDEAVKGVVASAFGYAGQKCSACSRAIVVGDAYERFTQRVAQAALSLRQGPGSDPASFLGPVIDKASLDRLREQIAGGKARGKVLAEAPEIALNGFYVPPIILAELPENDPLITQELFGPVLIVIRATDFDDALRKALDNEYALTGAVYSRSPKNLERAFREFRVGNLYINRGSTGALVMRQPFGGFAMSGVGSKAGGPDYLHQFTIPRVVSENTFRRGFAPMEEEKDDAGL